MSWMEFCDLSLTNRKPHPVDYFKMVNVFNGAAHAKIGFWVLEILYYSLWNSANCAANAASD